MSGKALRAGHAPSAVARALEHLLVSTSHLNLDDPAIKLAYEIFKKADVDAGLADRKEEQQHYMNGSSGESPGLTALVRCYFILSTLGELDKQHAVLDLAGDIFPNDVIERELERVRRGG